MQAVPQGRIYYDREKETENRQADLIYPPGNQGCVFMPASQMICQQVFTVSSKTANHLANTYALEYSIEKEKGF